MTAPFLILVECRTEIEIFVLCRKICILLVFNTAKTEVADERAPQRYGRPCTPISTECGHTRFSGGRDA